jgi:ABC-type nitrate/sulfonate/bicarbonate transport system substrate-binding protein
MCSLRHGISRRGVLATAGGLTAASLPFVRPVRAQSKKDQVNIVCAAGNLTATLGALIEEQGFFDKYSLDARTVYVSDGTKVLGSVVSGDMDVCTLSGFSNVLTAMQRGANLKIINGGVVLGQQTVVTNRPDIKSVKDLAGKTIGVGALGAQLHQIMLALLLKKGVDPSTVTWTNVGSTADVYRAVVQKTVDAGPAQIDVLPTLDKNGLHTLTDGDMWINIPDYPFQAGFANENVIKQKRDILVRMLAAYATLFRFVEGPNSRDAFRSARRKALSGSGQAFDEGSDFQWEFFQKNKPFAKDLLLSAEQINYLQDLNVRTGVQTVAMPYDRVVDMSLARDAVKLLS